MVILFGLVVIGIVVAPNLILNMAEKNRDAEQRRLTRIGNALVDSIQRRLVIPTYTNWSSAVIFCAGLDQTEVQQTNPAFSTDTNIARVFLIDPNLSSGLLPYTQMVTGLTGSQTNLLGASARVMLISNTKRSLTLPVTSGVAASSNAFYSIWNWAYDATTKAPPSGWPASWAGNGQYLHVYPLNLANLFHRVTLKNLLYGMSTNNMTNLVNGQTTFYFLRGTPLALATTTGTLKRLHVVNRDISVDFGNPVTALAWWQFSELSGTVATNSGTLGAAADGAYANGVSLNVAGPRPPTFSGFTTNNTGISLDGTNDYVLTTNSLMNSLAAFTMAGWINPATANFNNTDLFGQQDVAQLGFTTASKLSLLCDAGSKKLFYAYPYGANAWHHVAGVGDGVNMFIYLDGVQVATRAFAPAPNYGSSSYQFNIGGNVFSSVSYFNGWIDEVVVYDRALSPSEIGQLYSGQVP